MSYKNASQLKPLKSNDFVYEEKVVTYSNIKNDQIQESNDNNFFYELTSENIENIVELLFNKEVNIDIKKKYINQQYNNDSFFSYLLNNFNLDNEEKNMLLHCLDCKNLIITRFGHIFKHLNYEQSNYLLQNIDINLKNIDGVSFLSFNGMSKQITNEQYIEIIKTLNLDNLKKFNEGFLEILNPLSYEDKSFFIKKLNLNTLNMKNMNIVDIYFSEALSIELDENTKKNWLKNYNYKKIDTSDQNLLCYVLKNIKFSSKILTDDDFFTIIENSNYLNNSLNQKILKQFKEAKKYLSKKNIEQLNQKLNIKSKYNFSFFSKLFSKKIDFLENELLNNQSNSNLNNNQSLFLKKLEFLCQNQKDNYPYIINQIVNSAINLEKINVNLDMQKILNSILDIIDLKISINENIESELKLLNEKIILTIDKSKEAIQQKIEAEQEKIKILTKSMKM